MLTLLDTISHILGYFNINNKPLNMAWTIAAFLGDGYMAYIAYLALRNGQYARGAIYSALFIVFLYFVYLNFMYYFTNLRRKPRSSTSPQRLRNCSAGPSPKNNGGPGPPASWVTVCLTPTKRCRPTFRRPRNSCLSSKN